MPVVINGTTGINTDGQGNLTFSGTGQRIVGDFSNATLANRVMFQTSTANGSTSVSAIPSGTNPQSDFFAFNAADPNNASLLLMRAGAAETTLRSAITGTGTYLPMTFYTGGSERMRLDTSGNLGLGVTPSAWDSTFKNIQIGGNGFSGSFYSQANGDISNGVVLNAYFSSGWRYTASSKAATRYEQNNGIHTWSVAPSGTAGNAISFTQAMTLDASGNLLVGSTSGSGGIGERVAVTGGGIVTQASAGATRAMFGNFGSSDLYVGSFDNFTMQFRTNNIERARIDTSGNVGINTTSPDSGAKMTIQAASGLNGLAVKAGTNGNYGIYFNNTSNSTVGGIIINSGSVAYNTTSDYRLKENVQPMLGALAKVAQLKPCTYTWKADGSEAEGFIAHELAEVCPQAVTGEKDAVDEDGNPKYQGIDTSFLVATLTAAIQELKAELDTVKTELAALKGTA